MTIVEEKIIREPSPSLTDAEKAVYNDFLAIFSKGTQWQMAEEGIERSLEKIDTVEDWANYGEYQNIAAEIFNEKHPDYHVISWGFDYRDENQHFKYFWDFFAPAPVEIDFEEMYISIEKKPVIDGKKQIMTWKDGDQIKYSLLNHYSNDLQFYDELQAAFQLEDQEKTIKYLTSRGWQVFSVDFNIESHPEEMHLKYSLDEYPFQIICHEENRAKWWIEFFGTNTIPVKSLIPTPGLYEGKEYFFFELDLRIVTPEIRAKIIPNIAKEFNLSVEYVDSNLDFMGIPINADKTTLLTYSYFKSENQVQ